MTRVELLILGNEILSGETLDTNSQWLAQRLTALGASVARRTTILDIPEEIGQAVLDARDRGTRLLLTAGGLGPTFDDITVQSIGEALERPVAERADALEFVRHRYEALHQAGLVDTPDLLPARRKMAAVPEGSELIRNGVGTAPGIILDAGGFAVLTFPGVPRELHAMFEEPNVQALLSRVIEPHFIRTAEVPTPFNDESVLGPICDAVMREVPGAYLKSKANIFAHSETIPVLITCEGALRGAVEERLERARALLEAKCGTAPDA